MCIPIAGGKPAPPLYASEFEYLMREADRIERAIDIMSIPEIPMSVTVGLRVRLANLRVKAFDIPWIERRVRVKAEGRHV